MLDYPSCSPRVLTVVILLQRMGESLYTAIFIYARVNPFNGLSFVYCYQTIFALTPYPLMDF
jgi:hypothetical protein